MQLKTEFDKLFEDLKEDDKTCEMEAAGVYFLLNITYWFTFLVKKCILMDIKYKDSHTVLENEDRNKSNNFYLSWLLYEVYNVIILIFFSRLF